MLLSFSGMSTSTQANFDSKKTSTQAYSNMEILLIPRGVLKE